MNCDQRAFIPANPGWNVLVAILEDGAAARFARAPVIGWMLEAELGELRRDTFLAAYPVTVAGGSLGELSELLERPDGSIVHVDAHDPFPNEESALVWVTERERLRAEARKGS